MSAAYSTNQIPHPYTFDKQSSVNKNKDLQSIETLLSK